jgi:GT2 family glycosyltransferase/glycosyltransferase involved in cell wall biosynthesis/uncharacterized coiled-coil protein SlyX
VHSDALRAFFEATHGEIARLQTYFYHLGSLSSSKNLTKKLKRERNLLRTRIQERDKWSEHLLAQVADQARTVEALSSQLSRKDQAIEEQGRSLEAMAAQLVEQERKAGSLKAHNTARVRELEAAAAQRAERDRTIDALTAQVAERDWVVHLLNVQLREINASTAWRAARAMGKVVGVAAPRGSVRHRAVRLGLRGALIWWKEGFSTFLRRGTRKMGSLAGRMVGARPRPGAPGPNVGAEAEVRATTEVAEAAYQIPPETPPYEVWLANNRWNEQSSLMAEHVLRNLPRCPLFSVVMPVYNIEDCWLEKAVASVQAQVYPNWELCIADDASTRPNVRKLLHQLAANDSRIKVRYLKKNGNISAASNAAAEIARGEYIVLLDQDDELTPDCLLELAAALAKDPSPDIVYSDDDKIDEHGRRYDPQFKPDWSPELLLSYMYFGHVFCIRRELFEEVGGFREGFEGCQDYDLALRLTEKTSRIAHVPKVLYHWRALPSSTASSGAAKPEAFQRGIRAVQEALDRRGIAGWVSRPDFAEKNHLGLFQVDFPDEGPRVAIVIPTKDRLELVRTCVRSILEKTAYRNYEVVVIDNESDDPATLDYLDNLPGRCRVIRIPSVEGRFNYARLNNLAVEQLDHEYVLFLNNDTEVRRPEWLSQLVGYAQIDGVGPVGAKLIFPDGRLQHAGVITGFQEGMPIHAFKLSPWWDGGYLSYASVARNYSAVTAACLLVRRELFRAIGGFDETRFAVAYNDVDLCLRLREDDWRSVYAPRAELIHYESATRGHRDDPRELVEYRRAWGHDRDPYYNPNLSREHERFAIGSRRATVQVAPSRLPIRVLFCSHNLNLEGAPLYNYNLALELQARGRMALEVCSPYDGPLASLYREAGIPVHLPDFRVNDPDSGRRYATMTRMFAEWMLDCGFDVVHGNTLNSFLAIDAARQAGLPSLWTVHESVDYRTYFDQFGPSWVEPALRAFRYAYQVIFVAHATRALYRPLETEHNFSVIHVGLKRDEIDEFMAECTPQEARARLGCPQDKRVVTIVGTVCARKGQHVFAQAALELLRRGRRDVVFYIVGCRPGPYQEELEALVRKHGDEIKLVEETSNVRPYYRASDIFVCCSTQESYPAVILEAMAFRLPIVTTAVYGIAEQVLHETSALVFNPGDVAQLAHYLQRLLDSPSERKRLGDAAHCTLDTIISQREMIQAYEELFLEAFVAGARELPSKSEAARRGVA